MPDPELLPPPPKKSSAQKDEELLLPPPPKKKEQSSNNVATPSGNGLSGTPNPESGIPLVSLEDNVTTNPIDLAAQHNELSNAKKEISMGSGGMAMGTLAETIPDEGKVKKANDLKEFLKINRD